MTFPAYQPRVLCGVDLPPLEAVDLHGEPLEPGKVLIGTFHAAAAEVGVWQRLIGAGNATVFFGCLPDDVRAVTPPSRWHRVGTARSGAWLEIIEPDRAERAFAALVDGRHARMLVVGAPTEEVWEAFEGGILST